jgi:hypothetical protein
MSVAGAAKARSARRHAIEAADTHSLQMLCRLNEAAT